MLLSQLISDIPVLDTKGNLNIEIQDLQSDSRKVRQDSLFVIIRGTTLDGADFVKEAIARGAVAFLIERRDSGNPEFPENMPVIYVENARKALALLACRFYGYPGEKLTLIGVTGTKGKTTTTFMLKAILKEMGHKVGLIGSIGAFIDEEKIADTDRTTPESTEIQPLLARMVAEGVEIAILEVSSQAMKMHRVYGCRFHTAVFTNLSKDHISPKEHADLEEYFRCKTMLMEQADNVILNLDDRKVATLIHLLPNRRVITFGTSEQADCQAVKASLQMSDKGIGYQIKNKSLGEEAEIQVSIPGRFTMYNSLGAIAAAGLFGGKKDQWCRALKTIKVLGRSELVPNPLGIAIMIDYAHTPASLESILLAVKGYVKGRIICAWGVGGDRDREKRPIMGEISGRLADFTVLMSDQVRNEDPMQILTDIEKGLIPTGGEYRIVPDRTEGIAYAISMAKPGDMVLIPGLGHDKYLEKKGVKYPYDERLVIAEITEKLADDQVHDSK